MRRAYPILHLALIAAMLFAAIAMVGKTGSVAGGLALPPEAAFHSVDFAGM